MFCRFPGARRRACEGAWEVYVSVWLVILRAQFQTFEACSVRCRTVIVWSWAVTSFKLFGRLCRKISNSYIGFFFCPSLLTISRPMAVGFDFLFGLWFSMKRRRLLRQQQPELCCRRSWPYSLTSDAGDLGFTVLKAVLF